MNPRKGKLSSWSLTLEEKLGLFLDTNPCSSTEGALFFASTSLGMLDFPGCFYITVVLGCRCWGSGICVCIFAACVWESSFWRSYAWIPPSSSPRCPLLWKNSLCSLAHAPFRLSVVLGLRRPRHTKPPVQGCHLTDSKRVSGRWTAVCRWTRQQQRAEQIKPEDSKRKVLNHRTFQT